MHNKEQLVEDILRLAKHRDQLKPLSRYRHYLLNRRCLLEEASIALLKEDEQNLRMDIFQLEADQELK